MPDDAPASPRFPARRYGAGTYVRQPLGSVHRPASDDGAPVLVFLPQGIEHV